MQDRSSESEEWIAKGFSRIDGRSTIFDYWSVDAIRKGFFERNELTAEQLQLERNTAQY